MLSVHIHTRFYAEYLCLDRSVSFTLFTCFKNMIHETLSLPPVVRACIECCSL